MDEALMLQLSDCSSPIGSPTPKMMSNSCRLIPLLTSPAKATDFSSPNSRSRHNSSFASSVLSGVTAYVDVRTESDNRSQAVSRELEQLGATVLDKFSDEVTHLIYKDGKKRTLDMALRRKIHLVSVLWVESCKQNRCRVSEDQFLVTLPKKQTPVFGLNRFKRYKSMQPKTFEEEEVRSEEKVKRRRQQKDKLEKLRVLRTPNSCGRRAKNFFVADTQPRSSDDDDDNDDDDLMSPMPICVPDTPPSMRRHFANKNNNNNNNVDIRSPTSASKLRESMKKESVLSPVQRKFSFEVEDNSPEVTSLSSGSQQRSSHSLESEKNENVGDEAPNGIPTPPAVRLFGNILPYGIKSQFSLVPKEADSSSISPEIELQSRRDCFQVNRIDRSDGRKIVETDDLVSVTTLPKTVSKNQNVNKGLKSTIGLGLRNVNESKRKRLVDVDVDDEDKEEICSLKKKDRMEEKKSQVTFVSLSQLKNSGETSSSSPIMNRKRNLGTNGRARPSEITDELDRSGISVRARPSDITDVLDRSGYSTKRSSANKVSSSQATPTVNRKSFIDSSPTSSQEASRYYSVAYSILPGNSNSCDPVPTGGSQSTFYSSSQPSKRTGQSNVPPAAVGFKDSSKETANGNEEEFGSSSVTPDVKPPAVCADSLVLETRVKKRRQRKNVSVSSAAANESPVMLRNESAEEEEEERVRDSVETSDSTDSFRSKRLRFATVTLQRLPSAWNRSLSESNGTPPVVNDNKNRSPVANHVRTKSTGTSLTPNTGGNPTEAVARRKTMNVELRAVEDEERSDVAPPKEQEQKQKELERKKIISKPANRKKKTSSSSSSLSSNQTSPKSSPSFFPAIAMTSLHREEQKLIKEVVRKLSVFVTNEMINDETTHLVSGGERRTVKLLEGISRGLWIVSLDWIKKSSEAGRWLSEESFEMKKFFPSALTSRLERQSVSVASRYRNNLFSSIDGIYIADGTSPPKQELENLVSLCRGKVVTQLRNANVCVGKVLRQSIVNVSEIWILDSITEHRCMPTENYRLTA